MSAANANGGPMTDWQPIETAPKDGTKILGTSVNGADDEHPQIITWLSRHDGYDLGWYVAWDHTPCDKYGKHDLPTHWMPLPDPPK